MKLVSIATHSDFYFPFLKKSCRRFDSELTVLGLGQPWPGFSFKSKLIKEYLQEVDDNEIICVIDSYDVILLRPISELEEAFITYSQLTGIRLVVGHDIQPSVLTSTVSRYQFGTCLGIPLNAGTYIGYAKEIRDMVHDIYIDDTLDDQFLLTLYVQKNPHLVHIDTSSLFFLTINNPMGDFIIDNRIKIEDKTLYYKGIRPFFIHGNGNTNLNSVLEQLGYYMSENMKYVLSVKNRWSQYNKAIHYFFYHTKLVIATCIVLVLVIYLLYRCRKRKRK